MALSDLTDWMEEYSRPGIVWYAKRLAANDTLATRAHQAGPYVPKDFLFRVFPALRRSERENPDCRFDLYVDSHADHRIIRAVWYNNKLRGGTRDETRLTNFGGVKSALLDPESTGALAVFAFVPEQSGQCKECHVWVCDHGTEADLFEERIGPVEPKQHVVWTPGLPVSRLATSAAGPSNCRLSAEEIPEAWSSKFPSGEEIVRRTLLKQPPAGTTPDLRLVRRRVCEFEMFLSIEEAVYLPRIRGNFSTIEDFLGLAQTILQSRKSRSGNSLELHVREIMKEEGLVPGISFSHRPVTEGGKRPDFVFPSQEAYDNVHFPDAKLRMLAAKTTCKDRWRQVINEADRIHRKHLLTLQEGVSEGQYLEMAAAGVQLVVPTSLHRSYPNSVKPHLMSFEEFIGDVRLLAID
jgi:hypothetical protein